MAINLTVKVRYGGM